MENKFSKSLYKFLNRLKSKIRENNKIKIGILSFLVICLFSVIIIGNSYASKLNKKNVTLKVATTNNERNKEDKKLKEEQEKIAKEKIAKEKEEKIRKEKENKLKEIKEKIIGLDSYYNIEETFGDIDKDITHYESVYKELEEYGQEEENNTVFEENQTIYNNNNSNNNENNVQKPTAPITPPTTVEPTEPVVPPTEPDVPPVEPVVPPTTTTPTEPGNEEEGQGDTTPEVPGNPTTE